MKKIPVFALSLLCCFQPQCITAETVQPVSAWIQAFQETADEDPALADLRMGCYYRVTTRPILLAKLTPEQNAKMQKYDLWVESSGNALIDKWLAKQALTSEEQKTLALAKAAYLYRAWNKKGGGGGPRKSENAPEDAYVTEVAHRGEALMKKGYGGEALSESDLEGLRDYLIYSAMKLTSVEILPYEFNLVAKGSRSFSAGEKAPDFCALTMEGVMRRPGYTDALQQDESSFLKPHGVLKFLRLFEGYEIVQKEGKNICVPREQKVPEDAQAGDYLKLSDLKGKPVVLVLGYAPDVFWKVCAAPFEALHQLYKDRAHFVYMNVNYHDSYATGPVFSGEQGGNEVFKLLHPASMEQRARMSRAVAISFPNVSCHLALDDMSQTIRDTYFTGGGDARCIIIDKEGAVQADPSLGWMYWTKGPYTDSVMWLNEAEIGLRKALGLPGADIPATPGRFVGESRPSKRKAFEKREAKPYGYGAPNNYNIWLTGKIDKIEQGVMTVIPIIPPEDQMKGWNIRKKTPDLKLGKTAQRNFDTLGKWVQDATGKTPYLFKIEEDVELFVNGEEVELDAFKLGDTVAVWYDLDQDAKAGVKPVQVRTSRF